jgi:hypothetical protein
MRLEGYGIQVDVPDGWEGRIFRHEGGEPTLHVANFALPFEDGDFGAASVASMGAGGVFLALTEFGADLAGRGLFDQPGPPRRLRAADLSPAALQRTIAGRAGVQRFFTISGRAFCLYLVVGAESKLDAAPLVAQAMHVLRTVDIAAQSTRPM